MRTDSAPTRSLLAAATTVVALMAAAAGGDRGAPIDGRLAGAPHDPAGARVMAVVLAAARDLLLPELAPTAVTAPLDPELLVRGTDQASAPSAGGGFVPPRPPLGDRWPDLPPPAC